MARGRFPPCVIALIGAVCGCGSARAPRTVEATHAAQVITRTVTIQSPATSSRASPSPVPTTPRPQAALCRHLYAEWQAGDNADPAAKAAIQEYGQIGCDQAPPASAANCPTYYSPWGYTPNGNVICAPQADTPADTGNGDNTVTVPASP